jgi:death-on-curing protein
MKRRVVIAWIERALALAIHDRQLAEHGGSGGVRDESLLDSTLARPQQLHAYGDPTPDIAALAASLAFGLARNHPFVEGNTRAAHVFYRVFLALNRVDFEASDVDEYVAMLSLAEGSLAEAKFSTWLRERIRTPARKQHHEKRVRYGR